MSPHDLQQSYFGLTPEQKRAKITEIINPLELPAAAIQTYEFFSNNASEVKSEFISDNVRNPSLVYSELHQREKLTGYTADLDDAIEKVAQLEEDPDYLSVTVGSLEFRKAEIAYVELLATIDRLVNENGDAFQIGLCINQARELGHELYGRPHSGTVEMAYGEIWHQIEAKKLSESAEALREQLEHGLLWNDQHITGLPRPADRNVRLPNLAEEDSLKWAGEMMLADNADIVALVHEYWHQHVLQPALDADENPRCTPEQMIGLFEDVIRLRDPEGKYGVGVVADPKATALSWESPLMAVKVGLKRAAVTYEHELLGLVLHEFAVHGQRAINGLKTDLPVLGLGLFTNTDPPDYLTYEEGLASLVQAAISGDDPRWEPASIGHTVHIALIEDGNDFRSVFEKAWRYRLLMQIGENEEVTEAMITKQKNTTYTSLVRVFRGTPVDIAQKRPEVNALPFAFTKDLAYLAGRIEALIDLRALHERGDEVGFKRRFDGKYNPLIPEQAAIVEKVYGTPQSI